MRHSRRPLLASLLLLALSASSLAQTADPAPAPVLSWPALEAVPGAAPAGEDFPQYALWLRKDGLVGAVAASMTETDEADLVALRDAQGRSGKGVLGEDTLLLGRAVPKPIMELPDVVRTPAGEGPPAEGPEEFAKHAVAVEFVLTYGADGEMREVMIIASPSKEAADMTHATFPALHIEPFVPESGEQVRIAKGRILYDRSAVK